MNTPNPFAPPAANLDGPMSATGQPTGDVPDSVIAILAQTRPWLRLMLGLFVTGMALIAVAFIGIWVMGWFLSRGRPPGMGIGVFFTLLFVVGIYAPPAIYLARCSGSIRRLQQGGSWPALEDALRSQKSLWRYLGILILALIAVYGLAFLVGLAAG